jgi:hypothetical protein
MVDRPPVLPGRRAGHRHRPRRASPHQGVALRPAYPRVPAVFDPVLEPGERVLVWAPGDTEGFHVGLFGGILPWFALNAHYAVAVTDAGRMLFVHTSPSLTVGRRVRSVYACPLSDVSLVACNHRFMGGVVLWFRLPEGAAFDSSQPRGRPRRLGFAGAWVGQARGIAALVHGGEVRPRGFAF